MSEQGNNKGDSNDEDRRSGYRLSDEDLERIAQRAADIVSENFTMQVGKTTIKLVLYVCGAVVIAGLAWLGINEKIKIG